MLTGNGVAFVLRVPATRHGDWWSTQGWWIFAGTAAVSLLIPVLAQGHISSLLLFGAAAVAVSGIYTPGIMLLAERFEPARRGRAVGWYAMALVDTLDQFPEHHPQRGALLQILKRLATAVEKYQDPKSGLWYQVLDKGDVKGNYLEASASCMFVYALGKAVRRGYLPASYLAVARKGYQGITTRFIENEPGGGVNLRGTVSVAGLGGNPYRDGSYEYYLSEKVVTNDPKGVGAFLLASVEMETAEKRSTRGSHAGSPRGVLGNHTEQHTKLCS